ncbi:hypothetical protein [Halalkalibacter flavus]|uniref:hypothetical protein n=1 Tax=Halalkalibacter flavus TaxID=3090668 RepID=UPI002FCAB8BC
MKPTLNQLINEFESKLNRKLRDIELKVLEFLVNTESDFHSSSEYSDFLQNRK